MFHLVMTPCEMMRSPPERQLRWQTEPVWRTDPHGKIGASKEAPVQPTIIESADYIASFQKCERT